MNSEVSIADSSFGLTRGKGTLATHLDRIELSALTMPSRALIRLQLGFLQVVLLALLFAAVQTFVVFPIFGGVIEKWTDSSYFREPVYAVVNTVKVGFGVATLFILPLIGAVWLADIIVHPLRRRSSIPVSKTIAFDKVTSLLFTGKGELKGELRVSFSQGGASHHVTFRSDEIHAICLHLLFHCVQDIQALASKAGADLVENPETPSSPALSIIACGRRHLVSEKGVEVEAGASELPAPLSHVIKGLLLRHLLALAYRAEDLSVGEIATPDVDFVTIDRNKYGTSVSLLSDVLAGRLDIFSSSAEELGATRTVECAEKSLVYRLYIVPNFPADLKFAPNWIGQYKASLHVRSADLSLWGKDLVASLCDTIVWTQKRRAEERKKQGKRGSEVKG